jgi:hypothetical protein
VGFFIVARLSKSYFSLALKCLQKVCGKSLAFGFFFDRLVNAMNIQIDFSDVFESFFPLRSFIKSGQDTVKKIQQENEENAGRQHPADHPEFTFA